MTTITTARPLCFTPQNSADFTTQSELKVNIVNQKKVHN